MYETTQQDSIWSNIMAYFKSSSLSSFYLFIYFKKEFPSRRRCKKNKKQKNSILGSLPTLKKSFTIQGVPCVI